MDSVAPGIRRLPVRTPTLPPATHTNVWVLGEERVTVIDPASPDPGEQERLAQALAPFQVERIVLTHHHHDHVGGVMALRRATGAPVLAHADTAALLPFEVDLHLDDGGTLQTDAGAWRAVHTPGHAHGHLCFEGPQSHLVAGDMVAGVGTILLAPPEGDLAVYLQSLARLRERAPGTLLPAHGDPIPDGLGLLDQYIAHRHQRTAQIQAALAQGPARPLDLVVPVYGDTIPRSFHGVAAQQVHAHLLWLQAEGLATRSGDTWRAEGP